MNALVGCFLWTYMCIWGDYNEEKNFRVTGKIQLSSKQGWNGLYQVTQIYFCTSLPRFLFSDVPAVPERGRGSRQLLQIRLPAPSWDSVVKHGRVKHTTGFNIISYRFSSFVLFLFLWKQMFCFCFYVFVCESVLASTYEISFALYFHQHLLLLFQFESFWWVCSGLSFWI